jgi:hypothetical protein
MSRLLLTRGRAETPRRVHPYTSAEISDGLRDWHPIR